MTWRVKKRHLDSKFSIKHIPGAVRPFAATENGVVDTLVI